MKVAVLGYGVVGKGVVELLDKVDPTLVKYIYTLGSIADDRYIDASDIFMNDESVGIVLDATGNIEVAYDLLMKAMAQGKHTITSSKGLVAKYGDSLIEAANANGVNFMIEASVGGGIPLLSMMRHGLAHEPIYEVHGILNGTTNYILTQMRVAGISFEAALKDAQALGFAEADPTDDVKGYDAARKIAIIGSILSKHKIRFEDVGTVGIDAISPQMLKEVEGRVRLVASLSIDGDTVQASVGPTIVTETHPFYNIEGVNNAVLFRGKDVGDVLVSGAGAGRYPTASAMVSDVLSCLNGIKNTMFWDNEVISLEPFDPLVKVLGQKNYVRRSEVGNQEFLRVMES